jgi:hypothetical protein
MNRAGGDINQALERRYRRLLRLYPKAFRRQHEEEILAVLMAGASETQTRPRPAETFNLLIHASLWRIGHLPIPNSWEYSHARVVLPVRVVIGIWLLVVTAILYGYGRAGWWTPLIALAAFAHFYIAYRLRHRPVAH